MTREYQDGESVDVEVEVRQCDGQKVISQLNGSAFRVRGESEAD